MDAGLINILRQSEWPETDVIKSGDILSCLIGDRIVESVIKIHPKEISVKLLAEDVELTASAKLMLMAPVIYKSSRFLTLFIRE